MKRKFTFKHRIPKKVVRNLKIVTIYEEVEVRGEATRGCAINPISERSEFWYNVELEEIIWHYTNVLPFMEVAADDALEDIQQEAEKYARTIFSPAKEEVA